MQIATMLAQIDSGFISLPVFQRGYVWTRDQVRKFYRSLYRGYPVGSLLFWDTQVGAAATRGDVVPLANPVRMLLDGQQRATSLYGVMRGKPPPFFEGNDNAFTGLYFHLDEESFEFFQPVKMKSDPLWVDVSEVMRSDVDALGSFIPASITDVAAYGKHFARLGRLVDIGKRELSDDVIAGAEKTVEEVVDIFNQVNSGGTSLSIGDLTLARICGDWPEARETMNRHLANWRKQGYDFDLVWLLRSINTIVTGEARLHHLAERSPGEIQVGLEHAVKALNIALLTIQMRLGLDHGRVLFGRNALPVMAHYIHRKEGKLTPSEQSRLLYWYALGAMRGRFTGAVDSTMDQDLAALEDLDDGLDRLVERLERTINREIAPSDFDGATRNSRFYPVLYMLSRVAGARDFCSGLPIQAGGLIGGGHLELHHIFPKSKLPNHGYDSRQTNALANFAIITAACNKEILTQLPEDYFPHYEGLNPGVLVSQWIPEDGQPWTPDRYLDFLAKRRKLLADTANKVLSALRAGSPASAFLERLGTVSVSDADEEEAELTALQDWMTKQDLHPGELSYDLSSFNGDSLGVVLDLAWPNGVQAGLSQPVAVLLNEPPDTYAAANNAGFRCFLDVASIRHYIETEILGDWEDAGQS